MEDVFVVEHEGQTLLFVQNLEEEDCLGLGVPSTLVILTNVGTRTTPQQGELMPGQKFVKKPVVVRAVQWIGTNLEKMDLFTSGLAQLHPNTSHGTVLRISTLEGEMSANLGDWIIQGIRGEFYPCKPDIFLETYQEVYDQED